ncbi:MAG: hypothetical protein JWN78_1585 [Bacteroidota bacterium]|nr:hypothetical protein [Bacteroidota bacterium]
MSQTLLINNTAKYFEWKTYFGNITRRRIYIKKLPEITLLFWIMKICATTLGETGGDLFSMTFNIGYSISSVIFITLFFITVIAQLLSKKYIPVLYWAVIVSTSTAGTTMSDFIDRTLGLGYALGSGILIFILITILSLWRWDEKSLSVTKIKSFKGELYYWTAILFSNTLGTAFGDFLSDNSGLGFAGGALLIGGLLALIVIAVYFTKISRIFLFWTAFVLTRPFGATFGDLLTKSHEKGGLDFGTIGSSLILFFILTLLIIYATVKNNRESLQ